MSRATSWVAAPVAEMLWSGAGDDYVLYHRPSGKTHFVNAATRQLLTQVLSEPRDLAAAAAELAGLQSVPFDADFVAQVGSLLQRCEELGLVRRP